MIRKLWILAAAALILGLAQGPAIAQYGPPSSGPSAAILFTPATVNLIAGLNGAGSTGNGGLATAAKLNYPVGIAYDSNGNLFFADENNFVVRRIDHITGDISVFAGTSGVNGFSTGGGVATSAQLESVSGLVLDTSNNVYVADRSNDVVWKITPGGAISVYAGGGSSGLGDGGAATSAQLNNPWALGIDASNNIYIADSFNDLIREVNHSTGIITTFAGVIADAGGFGACSPAGLYSTTTPPYTATQAHLCFPQGIAFDSSGNAYIEDTKNNIVRVVNKSTGYISTYAGGGTSAYTVNGIPATSAAFDLPAGIYIDPANRVYIGDSNVIRVVDSSGNINTVFGTGGGEMTGSIGLPDTESINPNIGPVDGIYDFVMDPYGNLVAADSSGSAITSAGSTGQYVFPQQQIYATSSAAFVTISNPSGVALNFIGTPVITGPFAISGGTCSLPGSLAPGASCTVGITFTPIADQLYTGSILLASNANSSPSTISLSGTGTGAVTISGTLTSTLPNFTSPVGVISAQQTATLTNTGQGPLAINTAATSFVGANPTNFALASTDCPATLNAGSSCHFYVTFTPSAATTYSAELQVVVTNYGDLHTTLSGTGTASAVTATLLPNPLAFGGVIQGQVSAPMSAALTNTGSAALNISAFIIAGTNPSDFAITTGANACGASLAAGATCYIYVTFTPASATSFAATLQVADNAIASPQTAALTGTGTIPQAVLSPNPLAFPSTLIGAPAAASPMTLSNPGTAALTITSISVTGTNASSFGQSNNCGASLAAGATCTITVTFTPGSAGSLSAAISVADNATGSLQTAAVTGTGTAPQAVLSPNPLAFPSTQVGASATALPMTLSNSGTAALTIASISVTGANASSFGQTNNCGSSLAPGAACTITATFTPASATSLSASISVADNASGSPQSAAVTGTGTVPLIPQAVLSPNPLAFPSTIINTPATALPMTLSNPGNTALTITSISVTGTNAGNFSETNNCGATLVAGATCTITVGFTPTSAATLTAAISVADNAAGSPQSAVVTGTGSAGTYVVNSSTPSASIQPGSVAQFNIVVAPLGGTFNNLVTLSAAGLPAGAQYSFLPPAVIPGSAGAPSVLSIQTSTGLARLTIPKSQRQSPLSLLALLAGLPLLGFSAGLRGLGRSSRRWMFLAAALLTILPILALTGCGGGYFGPAPQTYTVTVTGTSGSLQESTTISLTVQ